MLEEQIRMKSRNMRRKSRGTLIFRIVGGVCWLILLVVAVRSTGKLGESRQDNEDLRDRLNSVVEGAPAGKGPTVAGELGDSAELVALKEALSVMKGEMEQLQKQSAQEREEALKESARERETFITGIADALNQIGASRKEIETLLADLPSEARLRLLRQLTELEAAAVGVEEPRTTEVAVIPPPDEESEEDLQVVPEPDLAEGPGEGEPEVEPVTEEPMEEDKPEFVTYTVKQGDSLSQIDQKFDVGVAEIMELNGIVDARKLMIGQVLKIPRD